MMEVSCQSSIKIMGSSILYFDPLHVKGEKDADYIFITHSHYDHFSKEDILKIKQESTMIIGPYDLYEDFLSLGFSKEQIRLVKPNETLELNTFSVKTVPAYNVNKKFHLKENGWVGYVLLMDGVTYYMMGDTDALEENKNIVCDVLFIPIGGIYTMNALEAATFTNQIKPKQVVPIHYGFAVGSRKDFDLFSEKVDVGIEILDLLK